MTPHDAEPDRDATTATTAQAAAPTARVAGHRPCVLVVEDDPDAAALLVELLEFEGYSTLRAASAAQALAQVAAHAPDAVLTDLSLPDQDGLGLAVALAARLPGLRFMGVLTGHGESHVARLPGAEVFTHRFSKPVDFDVLLAALRAALRAG